MIRTDAHRPSAIIPDDYEFVAFEYLRVDDIGSAQFLMMERERLRAHMKRTGGTYSKHQHGGNCHICGSVNAVYTAMFYHEATNSYVRTGLDCAEKLECSGIDAFRRKVTTALEGKKGKRKAQATLEAAGLGKAWEVYAALDPTNHGPREEATVIDIVGKLVQYGSISDAQTNFLRRLVDQIVRRPEIEAQRKAEQEAAAPVPVTDKRMTVRGKVLSIRMPEAWEFQVIKMLVQHADGWKVWGSVPSVLIGDLDRGAEIEFDAKVKVSDKDLKFGFFSRPTKARII